MGKRGPQKTPTEILERRGSWLAPLRDDAPRAESGIPAPPESMPEELLPRYRSFAEQALALGVMTFTDGDMLTQLAEVDEAYWRTLAILSQQGEYVPHEKQGFVAHPATKRFDQLREARRRMLREFGLSPSSRADVSKAPVAKAESADAKRKREILGLAN